jgi:CSLREA domain-containing protein
MTSLLLIVFGLAPRLAQAQGNGGSSVTPQSTGAIITVDTTADNSNADGKCSLREAIDNAENNTNISPECAPGGSGTVPDTIVFAAGINGGTITLDGDVGRLPDIKDLKGLIIDGGNANITISGGGATGVFKVSDNGTTSGNLTLNKLTVSQGAPSEMGGAGGGAINQGTLNVTDSTFSENTAGFQGGAIDNSGTLTVTNSTFSKNSTGSDIRGQGGGGVFNNLGAQLSVTNSTFSGNSSATSGGGLFNSNSGSSVEVTVTNSTFSNNTDVFTGGGVFNNGPLTVTNSTFSGNSSDSGTGGIDQFNGTLTLTNSTFSGNGGPLGGGIRVTTPATLKNTILANSPSGGNCTTDSFFGGQIIDDGFNISSDASCAFSQPTSRNSTNPLLDPNGLQDNGGPTKTIALLPTSPAVNAIPPAGGCGVGITTDQRGVSRPQGPACEIGAFELQPPPPPPPPPPPHKKKKHKKHHHH